MKKVILILTVFLILPLVYADTITFNTVDLDTNKIVDACYKKCPIISSPQNNEYRVYTDENTGGGVRLIILEDFYPNSSVTYSLNYVSGSGNNIHFPIIDEIPVQDVIGCSNCGVIGFWNTNGSFGSDVGRYTYSITFGDGIATLKSSLNGNVVGLEHVNLTTEAPYSLSLVTDSGHNGNYDMRFGSIEIENEHPIISQSNTKSEKVPIFWIILLSIFFLTATPKIIKSIFNEIERKRIEKEIEGKRIAKLRRIQSQAKKYFNEMKLETFKKIPKNTNLKWMVRKFVNDYEEIFNTPKIEGKSVPYVMALQKMIKENVDSRYSSQKVKQLVMDYLLDLKKKKGYEFYADKWRTSKDIIKMKEAETGISNSFMNLSGFEFEKFIAELFRKKGYRTNVTSPTADYGIDVIAEKGNERIAIQCKRLKSGSKVGNRDVQKAMGSIFYHKCNKCIIVTNRDFTKHAIEQARSGPIKTELWNNSKLDREVREYLF